MSLIIGLLTFFLVLNCVVLMLLVLIQLPKKEAGAGVAFGASTTDALFGAGSGNALTNITKYSAAVFIGLSLLLSVLNVQQNKRSGKVLEREVQRRAAQHAETPAAAPKQPAAAAPSPFLSLTPSNAPAGTPANTAKLPELATTNAPVSATTNAPKK
jgi:protein translocase SecG subunit